MSGLLLPSRSFSFHFPPCFLKHGTMAVCVFLQWCNGRVFLKQSLFCDACRVCIHLRSGTTGDGLNGPHLSSHGHVKCDANAWRARYGGSVYLQWRISRCQFASLARSLSISQGDGGNGWPFCEKANRRREEHAAINSSFEKRRRFVWYGRSRPQVRERTGTF